VLSLCGWPCLPGCPYLPRCLAVSCWLPRPQCVQKGSRGAADLPALLSHALHLRAQRGAPLQHDRLDPATTGFLPTPRTNCLTPLPKHNTPCRVPQAAWRSRRCAAPGPGWRQARAAAGSACWTLGLGRWCGGSAATRLGSQHWGHTGGTTWSRLPRYGVLLAAE
jgi:hypothetical protein